MSETVSHGVALVVLRGHLDADAGELAATGRSSVLAVLLLGQVLRERIVEGVEQAADRALDEEMLVDLADVVLGDVVVRVPERPEQVLVVLGRARRGAGQAAQREAGDEERRAADGDDQEDRDERRVARAPGLARRSASPYRAPAWCQAAARSREQREDRT